MSSIIKSNRVRVDLSAPVTVPANKSTGAGEEPAEGAPAETVCHKAVRLLELEGRVHALELSCSCGEKTIIEFDYAGDGPAEEPVAPQEETA